MADRAASPRPEGDTMSRKSLTTVAPVADTTVSEEQVNDTETTEASYEPNSDTLVADYQSGRVSKRDAKAWVEQNMLAAVGTGNLAEAQSWVKLLKEVDSATRTSGRTSAAEIDPSEYVQAIVARATALKQAALDLLGSVIVPADVPDSVKSDVAEILAEYTKGNYVVETTGEVLKSASEPIESLAKTRVIGYNKITSHLDDIVSGKAQNPGGFPFKLVKGQTYRISEIANLKTDSYSTGVSVGALANRFTHKQAERFPAGWVYAEAKGLHGTDSVHGMRFVGTEEV